MPVAPENTHRVRSPFVVTASSRRRTGTVWEQGMVRPSLAFSLGHLHGVCNTHCLKPFYYLANFIVHPLQRENCRENDVTFGFPLILRKRVLKGSSASHWLGHVTLAFFI